MKRIFCFLVILGVVFSGHAVAKKPKKNLEVLSYYGKYVVESKRPGLPADSLSSAILEPWLDVKANKKYKIGILLPSSTAPYWRSIHFGMTEEAKRLGLDFVVLEAGGYDQMEVQRKQLTFEMPKEQVDGVILGSLSYNRFDQTIQEVQQKNKFPIIAVGNDVYAPAIQGKVLSSFQLVGKKICDYIIAEKNFNPMNLAFLPGPKDSGWAEDTMRGFEECIQAYIKENESKAGQVRVMAELYGPMVHAVQAKLAEDILTKKEGLEYLVANAIGALEAANMYGKNEAFKEKNPDLKIISTYSIPATYDSVSFGGIHASVSDKPMEMGRVAVDMLVRILNGEQSSADKPKLPFRISPTLSVIDEPAMKKYPYEKVFGPRRIELIFRHPPAAKKS